MVNPLVNYYKNHPGPIALAPYVRDSIYVRKDFSSHAHTADIVIGDHRILNRFRNPNREPIWRFLEYGTYQKRRVYGFIPARGKGMYEEGYSAPVPQARPHTPYKPLRFMLAAKMAGIDALKKIIPEAIAEARYK